MSDNILLLINNLRVRGLDALEIILLARKADENQRKAALNYMRNFQEQKGDTDTHEKWLQYYNGVKKRLVS